MACERCTSASEEGGFQGVYALQNACCVGRLIANTPQIDRRRTMLEWYEKTKGAEFIAEVKAEIVERFKVKRKL